jgi:hypothetical protein
MATAQGGTPLSFLTHPRVQRYPAPSVASSASVLFKVQHRGAQFEGKWIRMRTPCFFLFVCRDFLRLRARKDVRKKRIGHALFACVFALWRAVLFFTS